MTTKSNPDEWWMSTGEYAARLKGLTVNLMYQDVMAAVPFHTQVLGATAEFTCADFASFSFDGFTWMLHADPTYDGHHSTGCLKLASTGVWVRNCVSMDVTPTQPVRRPSAWAARSLSLPPRKGTEPERRSFSIPKGICGCLIS
jgi:hypothetical protein